LSRADDDVILAQAVTDRRILITLDGHFDGWAVLPLREHPGVIRVKGHPATNARVMQVLAPLLTGREAAQFANRLVIASPTRVRWFGTSE
jgi:hypothetical protein